MEQCSQLLKRYVQQQQQAEQQYRDHVEREMAMANYHGQMYNVQDFHNNVEKGTATSSMAPTVPIFPMTPGTETPVFPDNDDLADFMTDFNMTSPVTEESVIEQAIPDSDDEELQFPSTIPRLD